MADAGVIGIQIRGDASNLTAAVQTAGREIDSFGAKTKQTASGVESLANGLKSAFVGSSVAVAIIGLKNTMGEFTRAMVDAQIQADKLRNGLNFAVGKSASGAELEFIRNQAKGLGLEFVTTAQQYTKLAAAARGTSLEGDKARKVFESIAQASTVMGLSAQETEDALLAVTQIISKGKVQAEELRGQLGERLPGAFQIAARAMGVTTAELDKMLETGKVLSTDFLPKFAAQLTQEVAPDVEAASKSMQASINRLNNAWTDFKQTVSGAGVSAAIARESAGVSQYIEGLRDAMENAKKSGAGLIGTLSTGLGTAIARAPFDVLALAANTLNGSLNFASLGALKLKTNFSLLPEIFETNAIKAAALSSRLVEAQTSYASLQEALKKNPQDIYLKSQTYQAYLLTQQLQAAKDAQDKLSGNNATREGIIANGQGRTAYLERVAAEKKAQQAALAKFNNEFGTPQDKLSAEIIRQKELLGDLYTPALEAKIRAHFIKPTKDAGDAFADQRTAAKDWEKFYLDFVDLRRKAENNFDGLLPAQAKLAEFLESTGYQNMAEPARQLALEAAYAAVSVEQLNAAIKAQTKERDELLKKFKGGADEQEKQLLRYEDEAKAVAVATAKNISLASAVELVAVARLNEALAIQLSYGDEEAAAAIRREIEARKKLSTLINDKDQAKATFDEFKRGFEATDALAREAFASIAEDGTDAAKKIGDALRKALLSAIYETTLKPIVFQIYASLVGGSPGTPGSALERAAGVNGSGGPNFLSDFAGASAGGFDKAGQFLINNSGSNQAIGDFGASLVQNSKQLGAYAQKAGNILGYLEAATNFKDGSYGKAIGQGIGTLIAGPIGGQIGKSVGDLVDKLFAKGEYVQSTGDASRTYGTNGALTSAQVMGGVFKNNALADGLVDGLQKQYAAAAAKLGVGLAATNFVYGSNNSDGGKFALGGGAGAFSAYQAETKATPEAIQLAASRAVFAALQGSDLPAYLSKVFSGITAGAASQADIDAALNYASALKTIRDALTETRTPLEVLNASIAESFKALGTSAETFKADFVAAIDGGITPEQLAQFQQLGLRLDELAESSAEAAKKIAAELLAQKGYQDKIDILTGKTTQRELDKAAALAEASDATDILINRLYDLQDAAAGVAETARVAGIVSSQKEQLLNAQGLPVNASGSRNGQPVASGSSSRVQIPKTIAELNSSLDAFAGRIYQNADANGVSEYARSIGVTAQDFQSTLDKLAADDRAAQDAFLGGDRTMGDDNARYAAMATGGASAPQAATDNFAAALKSLTDKTADLQTQLLAAQGKTLEAAAAQREAELAKFGFDGERLDQLRAQFDINDKLTAQIKEATEAAEAAANAVKAFDGAMAGLLDTNTDLQAQLLKLQGDEAGAAKLVREKAIASLTQGVTPADAARLIAQYDANEALKLKIEDLTKAQQDAASAADKLKSTWASITDGLLKEVDRIRGVMAETAADSYAALESRFAIATAQARAGDQTAAGNLTSYSGQLSSAITEQAGSRNELVRLQAQLAQSLQDTAVILGAPVTPVYAPPVLNSEKLEASIATLSAKIVSLEGQLSAINSNTNRTALATETLVDLAP